MTSLRAMAALLPFALLLGCGEPDPQPKVRDNYQFGSARSRSMEHLSVDLQQQIKAGNRAWQGIVLHSSDGDGEDFASLTRHHEQVLQLPHGLAWHFLIGDGEAMPAGEIRIGPRWTQQLDGEALSKAADRGEIQICLLGEADERGSLKQLAALDELLTFLINRYGPLPLRGHDQLESPGRPCPGDRLGDHHWVQLHHTWPRSVVLPRGIDPEESDGQ